MTVGESLTSLMNASRSWFDCDQKLTVANLTSLLAPNSNLAVGSDDYLTGKWGTYASSKTNNNFKSLTAMDVFGGGHIGPVVDTKPGSNYTYSFFVKATTTGEFQVKMRQWDRKTDSETAKNVIVKRTISDTNWHRYSVTFTASSDCELFLAENWPGHALIAGQKVEIGTIATPYISKENRWITTSFNN